MKIGLVIFGADTARGGAEVYTINLARSLRDRGHDVSLLAHTFAPGLPAIRQVPLNAGGLTRAGRYLRFLDTLDQHLAAHRYDIIHAMLPVRWCDVYHPHAGLAAQNLTEGCLRHNDPLRRVLSRIGTSFNCKRQRLAAVERRMIDRSDGSIVLCLSNAMRQAAARSFPQREDRLTRLLLGIDLRKFDPAACPEARDEIRRRLNIAADTTVALVIGQDFQLKGVPQAIAVVAQVNDPRLALVVVGRDDPAGYRRQAASLGIADRVIFAGSAADVRPFYRAADFLLYPSRSDTCGLVVFEAVAMGLPVIVTRQAGAHEVITPGGEGFVVDDPRDIPALADATRRLLDRALRRQMRDAALALRPQLSQDRHVDELLRIYRERLHSRGSSSTSA